MKKVILWALLTCLFVGVLEAEIITVEVMAEVTVFEDHGSYFGSSIAVGTPLTMTYSYDTEVEGVMATQTTMSYTQAPPSFIEIELGNYIFQNSGNFDIGIRNSTSDSYQLGAFNIVSSGLPQSNLTMSLIDSTGTVLSGYELPIPDFGVEDWDNGAVISIKSGRNFDIYAGIKSIEVIPEPASFLLLSFGGLLLKRYIKG